MMIFFSWQSDIRSAANRGLIQSSLKGAVKDLVKDNSLLVEPVIDRDTSGLPGSPDIVSSIFNKIDKANIFIADVTIINWGSNQRLTPNPNVLIELGYALKALTDRRIILVQNTAYGEKEALPFDLRQKRILSYCSPTNAESRASERKNLRKDLKEAIKLILVEDGIKTIANYPAELKILFEKKKISQDRHDYILKVVLVNKGEKPIKDYHVDIVVPNEILPPNQNYFPKVKERSNTESTFFRSTNNTHTSPIYPGDPKNVLVIDYYVDDQIYRNREKIFNKQITAKAYIEGELSTTCERLIHDMQEF